MAWAFVQGVSGVTNLQNGTATPNTATFVTQNTAAGNTLLMMVSINPQSTTLSSVTDSQGNTWVILPAITNGSSYNGYLCYALNTAGGSKPTITLHLSAVNAGSIWYSLGEYSGISGFRGSSTAVTNQFTPPWTSNAVTTVVGDLVVGVIQNNVNNTGNPTSSDCTFRASGGNGTVMLNAFADKTAASASSTVTWSETSGVTNVIQAHAFAPSAGAASGGQVGAFEVGP